MQQQGVFLQENAFSCRKMHFPIEKVRAFLHRKMRTFLQKNVVFGGHITGNRRKSQEGFRAQESRTLANFHKNFGALRPREDSKARKCALQEVC